MSLPADLVQKWGLSEVTPWDVPAMSQLWRADQEGHGPVVIKAISDMAAEERTGLLYLARRQGGGAVRILAREDPFVLMSYLPGPSLGDLSREGRDAEATAHLAELVARCRANPIETHGMVPLRDHIAELFELDPSMLPTATRSAFELGRDLARAALDEQGPATALHGDLHHDNVLMGPEGWSMIDAKGLVGDPAYELANVFRNPVGAGLQVAEPEVLRARLACFSQILGDEPIRLINWAAAQCAISMAWRLGAGRGLGADPHVIEKLIAYRQSLL